MKLYLRCRGHEYEIDKNGNFIKSENGEMAGDGTWKFLGVSTHHWHNHIVHRFSEIWEMPGLAVGGILWDLDHGTTRVWGGQYYGKLPRITSAWKN